MAENVEDYLEKGMYGAKEINPEEKKNFSVLIANV
ncbi:Uncharacterized conserved protein [Listeria grayi]|uniref:Uncharacterized conserved protein n=1 Tax=Listeria grayi TaxID=1641 RepID=A0A378MPF5_LISGR|nr:Uncharacterized conserved protein [Listeria grayi]